MDQNKKSISKKTLILFKAEYLDVRQWQGADKVGSHHLEESSTDKDRAEKRWVIQVKTGKVQSKIKIKSHSQKVFNW